MSSLGARIKAVRQREKCSQEVFAEMLQISRRTLITWEQDRVELPASALLKFRQLFDVSPEWLLSGEDMIPRRVHNQLDWQRFDTIRSGVRKMSNQAGIELNQDQIERFARVIFEAGTEVDDIEKKRLLKVLRSLSMER